MIEKVFIVNGYPQAGKDTFVDICINYLCEYSIEANKVSTIHPAIRAAEILGWDGSKTPNNRAALSVLKKISISFWDGPFNFIKKIIESNQTDVLFVFVREPQEIAKLVNYYPHIKTILIDKEPDANTLTNDSDKNVMNYNYDYTISNKSSLDALSDEAVNFVDKIIMGE